MSVNIPIDGALNYKLYTKELSHMTSFQSSSHLVIQKGDRNTESDVNSGHPAV